MKKGRTILSLILTIAAIICLVAAAVITINRYLEERSMQQTLESLRPSSETPDDDPVVSPVIPTPIPPSQAPSEEAPSEEVPSDPLPAPSEAPEPEPERVENPYADSYLSNEDMAGWLAVPGTVIDYPVMWTPRDENFYLRKDFYGNPNTAGCLILDTDSCVDPLTTNLIIHGHNMKAGTMFAALNNYTDPSFGQEHSKIILYTPQCQRNYEVIAVFRSQVYRKSDEVFKFYKFFEAETEEEFNDFYHNIKELSMYDTGVTASFGDCFITLSTCSYHVENGRLVVVAKEVEPGDYYLPLNRGTE